ncbi:MAG: hypothetical protein ACOCVG_01825 [Verrucomicrobiota bacterium]
MSTTTQKQQSTSFKRMTRKEFDARLKAGRARIRELKAAGKPLPNPTKAWSKKSIESLMEALSGR